MRSADAAVNSLAILSSVGDVDVFGAAVFLVIIPSVTRFFALLLVQVFSQSDKLSSSPSLASDSDAPAPDLDLPPDFDVFDFDAPVLDLFPDLGAPAPASAPADADALDADALDADANADSRAADCCNDLFMRSVC